MSKDTLTHYGIFGMKWGVRRTPQQLARAKSNVDASSVIVKETKNINSAVGNIRSSKKSKDISSMTDQELREKVQRMNLEQQYSTLASSRVSRGQTYVTNTLDIAGSALAVTSSALSIAIALKDLKK